MSDNKSIFFRKLVAEKNKARKFIRDYYKENGAMPGIGEVNNNRGLSEDELAAIDFAAEVSKKIADADAMQETTEEVGEWDYIWNEDTWNASYANGALKDYYVWADSLSPYKEDLWNTVEQRPANWNDIEKDGSGNPIEYEDGYHYANCERCWLGALNAPGAAYPWCGVKFTAFNGTIKLNYDGGEAVYPWGEYKEFKRTFAIASIPTELGMEYKLDGDGQTTFDPSKLVVTVVKA